VDASARGKNLRRLLLEKIENQVTGEELRATDEPYVFFVCNMGSAITTKAVSIFLFRFPLLGQERKLRAVLI